MLSTDKQERKDTPIATGVLDYFPLALAAVAQVSKVGNDQHNPGQPLHWARGKSMDQGDALIRHFLERGTTDIDGCLHSAKVAWRALALLQLECEARKQETADYVATQGKSMDPPDDPAGMVNVKRFYAECDRPAMPPPAVDQRMTTETDWWTKPQ